MQFPCSNCGKQLRIPDHHSGHPRVRCPNCQNVFRPFGAAPSPALRGTATLNAPAPRKAPSPAARVDVSPSRSAPTPSPRPPAGKGLSGSLGLILMLAVFFGPKIARLVMRERRPPERPPARQVERQDEEQRARRRRIEEALRRDFKPPPKSEDEAEQAEDESEFPNRPLKRLRD